jgi:ribonuclease P protein component
MEETLKKPMILRKRSLIRLLFTEGSLIRLPGLQVRWVAADMPLPVPFQVLFSVPKHRFRKATERNLLKRRMREVCRKHKPILIQSLQNKQKQLVVAFIYTGQDILSSSEIRDKIIVLLHRLKKENEKASG